MVGCKLTITDCIQQGFKGVICFEAALGYFGITSFDAETNPMFFVEGKDNVGKFISSLFSFMIVDKVDMSYVKEIADGLYVTRPERTVCDLIKYDRHEFFILEALDEIYNFESAPDCIDLQLLDKLVDEYGIRAEFDKLRQDSETFFDEE